MIDLRDIVGLVLDDHSEVLDVAALTSEKDRVLVSLDSGEVLEVRYHANYGRWPLDKRRMQLQAQVFDDGVDFVDALKAMMRAAGIGEPDEGGPH